jgi:hypothetical protein
MLSRLLTITAVIRSATSSLEPPDWLVELAARDDPPTVIEPRQLARFRGVGVTDFVPTRGNRTLAPEEAGDATGVGVVGPGTPFAESFEDEAAPVAAALGRLLEFLERFDKLRRFKLAAIDMRFAERTAAALRDRNSPARIFQRVLETGLIVTYARPYLARRGGVKGKWLPEGDEAREFHRWLIDELRNPYHAHADRTERRTLMDTAAWFGFEGPPTYSEAWWRLTDEQLATLEAIAGRQAERFEAEADRIDAELKARR